MRSNNEAVRSSRRNRLPFNVAYARNPSPASEALGENPAWASVKALSRTSAPLGPRPSNLKNVWRSGERNFRRSIWVQLSGQFRSSPQRYLRQSPPPMYRHFSKRVLTEGVVER